MEPEDRVVLEVLLAVQRAADAHVQRAFHVDEPLFGGPAKRCSVRIRGTEVGIPGIEVGVEVQHGYRAVVTGDRPKIG